MKKSELSIDCTVEGEFGLAYVVVAIGGWAKPRWTKYRTHQIERVTLPDGRIMNVEGVQREGSRGIVVVRAEHYDRNPHEVRGLVRQADELFPVGTEAARVAAALKADDDRKAARLKQIEDDKALEPKVRALLGADAERLFTKWDITLHSWGLSPRDRDVLTAVEDTCALCPSLP